MFKGVSNISFHMASHSQYGACLRAPTVKSSSFGVREDSKRKRMNGGSNSAGSNEEDDKVAADQSRYGKSSSSATRRAEFSEPALAKETNKEAVSIFPNVEPATTQIVEKETEANFMEQLQELMGHYMVRIISLLLNHKGNLFP